MITKPLVAISALLVCGMALANPDKTFPSVEVKAESENSLQIACANPQPPKRSDVERVLSIGDSRQTTVLSAKLMKAASEACEQGVARIVVTRTASGHSLTWAPQG